MHEPNAKIHSEVLPARRAWHRTALGVARMAGVVVAIIALSACVYVQLLPARYATRGATEVKPATSCHRELGVYGYADGVPNPYEPRDLSLGDGHGRELMHIKGGAMPGCGRDQTVRWDGARWQCARRDESPLRLDLLSGDRRLP